MTERTESLRIFICFTVLQHFPGNIALSQKSEYLNMSVTTQDIMGLQDIPTPFGLHLSGTYKRSFAYDTLKDRLPVIITKIIDRMSRNKDAIIEKYGQDSSEELKQVIGSLSELRSELMTNKPLQPLIPIDNDEKSRDITKWNSEIQRSSPGSEDNQPTWYNSVWLLSECYTYRRIAQTLALTKSLSSYDPFDEQKQETYKDSSTPIALLAKYTVELLKKSDEYSITEQKDDFIKLLKLNLWGNKCDLSLSVGASIAADNNNPSERITAFEEYLLIDGSISVWNILSQATQTHENVTIDMVLDNAGYELFTDLCIAAFLTTHQLAHNVRFYVKRFPWFVSDTTERDFHWMISQLKNSSDNNVKALGDICDNYLQNGQWSIEVESFWTEPFDFSSMKIESPILYDKLSSASLIIFKGDLNYRKLLGDINWQYDTDFKTALRQFTPANLVSLRTVKADLIVGVATDKMNELFKKQENWMKTGEYGIIQTAIFN